MRIHIGTFHRFAFAAASWFTMATAQSATPYAVTVLQVPDSAYSSAWGINNKGVIVGEWIPTDPNISDFRGFVLQDGIYTTLYGPTGALGAQAFGISDSGVIVGNYSTAAVTDEYGDTPSTHSGFIYSNGSYVSLQAPGGYDTFVRGISPDGRYVTGMFDADPTGNGASTGFIYDRTSHAFTVLAGHSVIAHGSNAAGLVVGSEWAKVTPDAWSSQQGFIYDLSSGLRSQYMLQAKPGSPAIFATAFRDINASGTVAGFFDQEQAADGDPYEFAFVGTPDDYAVFGVQGAAQTVAEGINDAGVVVGNYDDWDGNRWAIVATPVPEPASWLLMLSGAGLIAMRRRKA